MTRILDKTALGVAAASAARADRSAPVEIDGRVWFLSAYNPPLDMVIIGAVHIAQILAPMAVLAEYRVRIIDPRTAFATSARFPGVTLTHDWPDEALVKAPLGPRSALIALTHDPKLDDPALTAALRSDCSTSARWVRRKRMQVGLHGSRHMDFRTTI